MGINAIAPIAGILGIILGAVIQYYFAKRGELARNYQTRRTEAYIDFIKSSAALAVARRKASDNDEILEAEKVFLDSKIRLVIYGSETVVSVTAEFFRKYGQLTSPEALSAYYAILTTMRSETPGARKALPEADIGELLGHF